jgi:transposase
MKKYHLSKIDQEESIYERCAGIDVHKKMIVVCLRIGRETQVKEFGTLTCELREMAEWLKENDVQMAAMESTGSYWKPLYNIFEQEGIPAMVVNAGHMKSVPGRKTDVKDAEWIAKLLSQGLLKASFIPNREQREFRELTRFRKSQLEERARTLNRLQKMLEGANIKLSSWVSDIDGKSATQLLELIIDKEEFTAQEVARLRHSNMKASVDELYKSLDGIVTPIQRELFTHVMNIIKEQTAQIEKTEGLILGYMTRAYQEAADTIDAIPGIGQISAQQIVAEIGIDMSRFPSAAHLCNWAGICPGNNESAGKRKSGKTNYANKTLKSTLTQCAQAAKKNKDSFFYAQYQRLVVRRGKNRATLAVAHSLLIAIYHVLSGKVYCDLGADYYNRFNKEKKINSYVKQLSKLGVSVPDDVIRVALEQIA